MRTLSRFRLWAALGLLLALGGPAAAQDSPLAVVPAKAHVVVQLSGVDKAKGRFGKMLANALPDMAPQLTAQFDAHIRDALANRDLKAVVKDKPVFAVIPEFPTSAEGMRNVAILIPVTGYDEFKNSALTADERKTLKKDVGFETVTVEDETLYLVNYQGHAVAAYTEEAAKLFTGEKQPGLDGKLSPETAKAFLDQDLGIFLNVSAINEKYGFQIKLGKTVVEGLITQAAQGGNTPGLDKSSLEMIKNVLGGVFQVIEDGTALVLGVEFRPEGANLHLRAQFGARSTTNRFLKPLRPGTLAEMGTLPTGQLIYGGTQVNGALMRSLNDYLFGVMGAGGDDQKAVQAIEDALEELNDAGLTSQVSAMTFPMSTLGVLKFKDPAKANEAQLKLFQALPAGGTFSNAVYKGKPEIKPNDKDHRGFKLTHVRMKWDYDKMTESLPEGAKEAVRASIQKISGDELNSWFGTDGKVNLSIQASDWKTAQRLIDEYLDAKKTVGTDEGFQSVRKQLPAEATLVNVIDAGRFIAWGMDYAQGMMQMVPGLPGGAPAIPNLKAPQGQPVYFGMAIVLKSETASFDFFVPAAAVRTVRTMFAGLIGD